MDSWKRSQIYLRGWADARNFEQMQLALQYIEEFHKDQLRNGGLPYASHGIMVGGHLVALGFDDDCVIAAGIIHDVFEDTKYTYGQLLDMGFSTRTLEYTDRMTKTKDMSTDEYFQRLMDSPVSALIKVVDRFHNMSTMTTCFKPERARRFIDETKEYVYPLLHMLKKQMPNRAQSIYQLKYALEGLVETVEVFYPTDEPPAPLIVGASRYCHKCERIHPPGPCENWVGQPIIKLL